MSTMKLEPKTLTVLKNFSSINPSLMFREGSVVTTMSPTKSVLARARIGQSFEKQFAIYDLSRFLGVISLFDNPDLELNESSVTIRKEDRELDYRYADPSTIVMPPDKNVVLPSEDVKFKLTTATLNDLQRALSALSMPEIAVVGDSKKMWIQVIDVKNMLGDSYKISLGDTDKKFRFVFKAENLKFIPQDYEVTITSKLMSHFKGTEVVDIDYWVAPEKKPSSFEG